MAAVAAVWTFLTTRLVVRGYVAPIAAITCLFIGIGALGDGMNIPTALALVAVNVTSIVTGIRIAPRPTRSTDTRKK